LRRDRRRGRGLRVLIRSQELEDAAAATLSSGGRDVRELAALQLAGGAALDLDAAADILAPPALEAAGVRSTVRLGVAAG
jgi:hypothetical protein